MKTFYRKPFIVASAILSLLPLINGYAEFRSRMPNGFKVPHPCKPNYMWYGVGHNNPQGGGSRNPFGQDFDSYGRNWNEQLCQLDSDGDGKTNGYELGDPECTWKVGETPARTNNITHPGICEPVGSANCPKNETEICVYEELSCPPTENDNGTKSLRLVFNRTKVPNEETTYMCQFFDLVKLAGKGPYHQTAHRGVIDNRNVVHHQALWGCPTDSSRDLYATPTPCGMLPSGCGIYLSGWGLGSSGRCYHKDVGLRFGEDAWKYAVLQIHWNNPLLVDTYYDGSGLEVFYTTNLRDKEESSLTFGQEQLDIPPGQPSMNFTAYSTAECTSAKMESDATIHYAFLHMHFSGRRGQIEHFRNGQKLKDIIHDNPFTYDRVVYHDFDPPIEFLKGDELKLTCDYDTSQRTKYTHYGEAIADEMCYTWIFMSPKQSYNFHINAGNVDKCLSSLNKYGGCGDSVLGFLADTPCHLYTFKERVRPNVLSAISEHCTDQTGCTDNCVSWLKSYRYHPCVETSDDSVTKFINQDYRLPENDQETINKWMEKCRSFIEPSTINNGVSLRSSFKIIPLFFVLFAYLN